MSVVTLLVPLAVELLKLYFKNTDTQKDDQVLQVIQEGCYYLAPKDNNDLDIYTADMVSTHMMKEEKK